MVCKILGALFVVTLGSWCAEYTAPALCCFGLLQAPTKPAAPAAAAGAAAAGTQTQGAAAAAASNQGGTEAAAADVVMAG